jgi:hypothetical protein
VWARRGEGIWPVGQVTTVVRACPYIPFYLFQVFSNIQSITKLCNSNSALSLGPKLLKLYKEL